MRSSFIIILLLSTFIFSCSQKPKPDKKMLEVKSKIEEFENRDSITTDQKDRKSRSEATLSKKNIKINATLPYIESEAQTILRTPLEIAERVAVLAAINLVAFDNISADKITDYLKKFRLWDKTTPKEKAFLLNPTNEAKLQESWKAEGIWVLLWALEVVPSLDFPTSTADLNKVPEGNYPFRGLNQDPHVFIDGMNKSRNKNEILDAVDLYYRIDWACVDARINNQEIKGVDPSVVYERHYALNWLVMYMGEEWDDITCDT